MQSSTPKQYFFIYEGSYDNPRVMTVIHGIPFYESSGVNSHQKGTWFPHRGIREKDDWIMKPKKFSVPEKILIFCAENHIEDEVRLKRFGNLETLCISASLNTGFWRTEKGIIFRKWLYENYYDLNKSYFLDEKFVTDFLQDKKEHDAEIKKYNSAMVNNKLRMLSSIIPVNIDGSRLPNFNETEVIPRQMSNNMRIMLEMLLTRDGTITSETVNTIEILSNKKNLFTYAMSNYFDDPDQLSEINKLIKMRGNKVTLGELSAVNFLESDFVKREEYEDICENADIRKTIRQLNLMGGMTKDHLEILKKLISEETDKNDIYDIMTDPVAFKLLKRLLDEKKFREEDTIKLVITLKSYEATEIYQELFGKMSNDVIIFEKFLKHPPLSKENLKLISDLSEKGLIESTSILQKKLDPIIIDLIRSLLTENKLTARILEMLNSLNINNLLDVSLVPLIENDTARKILVKRIELASDTVDSDDENDSNAKILAIVKQMFRERILDEFEYLLNNNLTYKALDKLASRSQITHNNVLLIAYLHKTNSMHKFNDLVTDYHFLKELNELLPENANKKIPTLIRQFYTDTENVTFDDENKNENVPVDIYLTEANINEMKRATHLLLEQGFFSDSENEEEKKEKNEDVENKNDDNSKRR